MPSNSLTREAIVRALDDLGERKKIAGVWTDDAPDIPYPPNAVEKRVRRLRWRWKFKQLGSIGVGILVFVVGLQLVAGETAYALLEGVVVGGGLGFAYNAAWQWWKDAPEGRAMQLYELLRQMDSED